MSVSPVTPIARVEVRLPLETPISRCNTSLERISYVLLTFSFPLLLLALTFCANSSSISLSHCVPYILSLATEATSGRLQFGSDLKLTSHRLEVDVAPTWSWRRTDLKLTSHRLQFRRVTSHRLQFGSATDLKWS